MTFVNSLANHTCPIKFENPIKTLLMLSIKEALLL